MARLDNLIEQRKKLKEKFGMTAWGAHPKRAQSLDEQFLSRLHGLVESNLANSKLNVDWLSREMGVSRVQLHRKLTALVGRPASEIIKEYKLNRAAELLRQQAGNVSDVAYQVGFENVSYFTKVFKDKFKVTPSEFS